MSPSWWYCVIPATQEGNIGRRITLAQEIKVILGKTLAQWGEKSLNCEERFAKPIVM
jgi:hypothetical protein